MTHRTDGSEVLNVYGQLWLSAGLFRRRGYPGRRKDFCGTRCMDGPNKMHAFNFLNQIMY